jgi:hypothetical protein
MSLKITRDAVRGCYILWPEGPPGIYGAHASIPPVSTDNLDEVGAAIAHYFRTDEKRHEIFKRRGLCPLCEAMKDA